MEIESKGKQYKIKQVLNKMFITVAKEDIFAGYGVGNMKAGFKLAAEVQEVAPIEDAQPDS